MDLGRHAGAAPGRACGECSLCCTVLRVDELEKPAGRDCAHQRAGGGCAIHAERPRICRAYHCLWLRGGGEAADRPDRLGALVDVVSDGIGARLSIQEARPGAFDASPRLRALAEQYRASMPVRIVEAGAEGDADRPFRVLLPSGEEQRVRGEWIEVRRPGQAPITRRMPLLDRLARRVQVIVRRLRLGA